ncbi:MAG: hypothetical protein M3R21_09630, partial [Candidatus Dormibacteraeota bacterium]|nr:hypothetical protein [Candidatus Dormibacteraeota bacterium]
MGASHGLLGRAQDSSDDDSQSYGANSAEVRSFIEAAAHLTSWQWRQVLASRRLVASVTKEGAHESGSAGSAEAGQQETGSAASIQAAIHGDGRMSEPMSRAGQALFDALAKKSDDKQVAAWQAMSALVMRPQLPALKFAAHYAPFAAVIPISASDVLDPLTRRFLAKLEALSAAQCESLARRWRFEPGASHALLQAVTKHREAKSEEAAAMTALVVIPVHLAGDSGWAAIRTAVHGGRVLGCMAELSEQEVAELWAPLEDVIPLASLAAVEQQAAGEEAIAVTKAIRTKKKATRPAAAATPSKAAGPYGLNSVEVGNFIKGVAELTAIQWLRILDRRKLVATVTRDSSVEPAGVVRSILATIDGTKELDTSSRCQAFAAVERAGYAIQSHGQLSHHQIEEMYRPLAGSIPLDRVNGGGFAHELASLSTPDWQQVAEAGPPANEEAVAPLINAGTALMDFFRGRSDDEVVAAWHAVSALVRRHHLTPIKFAASYAPFGSAIPVTSPRALGAAMSRYITVLGRLGASQCAVLAQSWQVDDEASDALSKATMDGSTRRAEEASALAALVTVPMRLSGSGGWAAVKTATFGGRVIAARARLTPEQVKALWKPIQPAITLASLGTPAKPKPASPSTKRVGP